MNSNSVPDADSARYFSEIVSRLTEEKHAGRDLEEEAAAATDFLAMGS